MLVIGFSFWEGVIVLYALFQVFLSQDKGCILHPTNLSRSCLGGIYQVLYISLLRSIFIF